MTHVYVVTEDVCIFNIRVGNITNDVHATSESAEKEISSYLIKDGLIDGYKIDTESWNGENHTLIMRKWCGILRRVITVKRSEMREDKRKL